MTAPLPGGSRRAIVALRAAIEKGLAEAPKPVTYEAPPVTQAVPAVTERKHKAAYFNEPRTAADLHFVPEPQPVIERVIETVAVEPEKRKGGRPKLAGDPAYRRAKPFPHAVIEDFLPAELAEDAYLAFPSADDPIWREHGREFTGDGHSKKLECAKVAAMPEPLRKVFDLLTGPGALDKLKALTGFDDLFADPSLYGGGITLTPPGGFLDVHADFNWQDELQAYRTVNLLIHLNPDWQDGDGGELELWADGKCARSIPPAMNTAVVFTATDNALHGVAKANKERRTISAYYYRKQAAAGISADPHRTKWAD